MKAIDISVYQTVQAWESVYADGVRFVIIKATQGRALDGTGTPFRDPALQSHADGAVATGVPMGFYHFLCARDTEQAQQEAAYFLNAISPWQPFVRHVFLDCETYGNKNLQQQTKAQLTQTCHAFLQQVASAGYTPALYTNADHMENYLDISALQVPLWIAAWGSRKPQTPGMVLWQYGPGSVRGILGQVDLNVCYLDEAELSIQRLFALGYMQSPAYWIKQLPKVRFLSMLFSRLAPRFGHAATPLGSAEAGIEALHKAELLLTPEYWKEQLPAVLFLPELFCNLGGFTLLAP
ncbi:MAG: GH25 family lysozyme [Eubacteriales bacterium]|nr:GH25 family lysozyme [Eubacteriales bacterium]